MDDLQIIGILILVTLFYIASRLTTLIKLMDSWNTQWLDRAVEQNSTYDDEDWDENPTNLDKDL